jgi:monothiol glutaredoxin
MEISEPVIDLTDSAAAALVEYWDGEGKPTIRFQVPPNFEHELEFGEAQDGDFVIPFETCNLVVDRASARRCDGATIGFIDDAGRAGFRIENPQEPPRVRGISAAALNGWLSEGKPHELFDVRGADERETAAIEGARAWDESANAYVESLDPDTVLVFHCHHGGRSQAAAQHWVRKGFRQVYNLEGGIDAWSLNVDPEIPRY